MSEAKSQAPDGIEQLVQDEAQVRVSCSGFGYITVDIDGEEYVLASLSRSKISKKGQLFLGPTGGRYFHNTGEETLEKLTEVGVRYETDNHQLNFHLPESKAPEFSAWFAQREGREIDPLREIIEECVGPNSEEKIYDPDASWKLDKGYWLNKETEKAGGGERTFYHMELFRLTVPGQEYKTRIIELAKETEKQLREDPDSITGGIILLSKKEMAGGETLQREGWQREVGIGDLFQFFNLSPNEMQEAVANAPFKASAGPLDYTRSGKSFAEYMN